MQSVNGAQFLNTTSLVLLKFIIEFAAAGGTCAIGTVSLTNLYVSL